MSSRWPLTAVGALLGACQPLAVEERPLPPPLELAAPPRRAAPSPVTAAAPPAAAPPCPPLAALARLSCDGQRIELAGPLDFHPRASPPPPAARATLTAIAQVLREHPEVLLLRVDVQAPAARGGAVAAQARADAIFHWLWRRGGVDPERLHPLGRTAPTGAQHLEVRLEVMVMAPSSG